MRVQIVGLLDWPLAWQLWPPRLLETGELHGEDWSDELIIPSLKEKSSRARLKRHEQVEVEDSQDRLN